MEYQSKGKCMKATEFLEKLNSGTVNLQFRDELSGKRKIVKATLLEREYIDKEPTTSNPGPKRTKTPKDIFRSMKIWDTDNNCWVNIQFRYIEKVNGKILKNGVTP